ncbi:MAG: hypothetical protein ABW123_03845 [Cystobacter sp.]
MRTSLPAIRVVRGARVLRGLLARGVDLRDLEQEGFRRWLLQQVSSWAEDPAFVLRARIRDSRRAHPELQELERVHRQALAADEATPQAERLLRLDEELSRVGKALVGLSAAMERETGPEKHSGLRLKHQGFQSRQQALHEEQEVLRQSSAPRRELLRIRAELEVLHARLGLTRARTELAGLLRQQGQRSGRMGESFEQQVLPVTWQFIVPDLVRSEDRSRLRVLRGVGLAAARTELDQVLIRQPLRPGKPVDVLGLVEVKRNLNDLAHGFRRRQENLAWFTGDSAGYDASLFRTRVYHSGHFDREAVHEQEGERFVFARDSFHRFRREPDSGLFLRRLYFITRPGTLTGVSAAALSRIRHRVATDDRWPPRNEEGWRDWLSWCQSLAEPLESPDVLRLYESRPERSRQVLGVSMPIPTVPEN